MKTIGHFCGNCGEKEVSQKEYSLRHYLAELIPVFTFLDSKVFRSLWLVATRPGYLSSEYLNGRRVRYMKPLQLFLLLNVFYYFSLTLFPASTFTTPLFTQLHMNNYYATYANSQVNKKMEKEQITYQTLETAYNKKTAVLSKTLIFLLIPIFAFLFYALFFAQKKYFVEHLVVATHFLSFNLMLLGVILPAVTILLLWLFQFLGISGSFVTNDYVVSSLLQIYFGGYLFIMFRRSYVANRWYCAVTALTIAWAFFHIVWIYRLFLFEITLRVV